MFTFRSFLKLLISLSLLGIAALVVLMVYCYIHYQSPPHPQYFSQGQNGLWLRHQWVGDTRTDEQYAALCQILKQNHISDAFFHVGPLNSAGNIEKEKYPHAPALLTFFKQNCSEIRLQAWIGQVEKKGGGPLDLSRPEVRTTIISTAQTFLDLGFDGIHYDIEPIYQGDQNFLDLLKTTSELTRSKQKILSVATDELEPFYGAEKISHLKSKLAGFWTKEYYQEVAKYSDQIAVMMYDTAMPYDWLYGNLVEHETTALLAILPPQTTLFIGVPTYEDKTWGFDSRAENIISSLKGIQKALSSDADPKKLQNFGVAIYAEWETDNQEWAYYRREWLGQDIK